MDRIVIFVVYVLLGLLIEVIIMWLFPYTGLGGLICWPAALLFSLILGFVLFRVSKEAKKIGQLSLLILLTLFFQTLLLLVIHPQDFGGNSFEKIERYIEAYFDYDQISYDRFALLNDSERVIFIYKYKNRLPDSFSVLGIETDINRLEYSPRLYVIENREDRRIYDSTRLKFFEYDTATIIVENPYGERRAFWAHKNFLKNKGSGYGVDDYNLNINKDYLTLETGIEKLFYSLLKWTKKAY